MRELKLRTEMYQSDFGNILFKELVNELGVIPNSEATKTSKGNYNLFIQDGFKDAVWVFCPQNCALFNTVGSDENIFIIRAEQVDDSNLQIQILDQDLTPWEDVLVRIPFELYVYKNDFVPVEA